MILAQTFMIAKLRPLRKMVEQLNRRMSNHDEHIKYLLASVKELKRDRETDKAEIKRLRERLEREDRE